MSGYETYDATSRHYDDTRVPVGSEIILGCLACQSKPLNEQVVLDAGCGTGAYVGAIVERVGRIEALDRSRGMLEAAQAKLRDPAKRGRIGFHRGAITELPFAAESFDAVMINQVLHHLDDPEGFPAHRRVLAEFARILRRGGALVINTCTQEQLREAYWYYHLLPRATDAMCRRFAPLDVLRRIVEDAGFEYGGSFVPLDGVCQGDAYFDGRGPLSPEWRAGDSVWALTSEQELSRACARVRELDRAGALDAFVAEHDAGRRPIGQVTLILATRA